MEFVHNSGLTLISAFERKQFGLFVLLSESEMRGNGAAYLKIINYEVCN